MFYVKTLTLDFPTYLSFFLQIWRHGRIETKLRELSGIGLDGIPRGNIILALLCMMGGGRHRGLLPLTKKILKQPKPENSHIFQTFCCGFWMKKKSKI